LFNLAKKEEASVDSPTGAHPRALAPANLLLTLALSVFGAIIGIQMMANVGLTPSTSLVGALAAMALARIPLQVFAGFRSPHAQNLAQTSISSATFGAANSLFLPIGIPYLFGLPNMVGPMLIGVSLAMFLDGWMLYRLFNSPIFPATNPWPLGVAAAQAIRAGDSGGKQAGLMLCGVAVGAVGALMSVPMSAFAVALIGGFGAMVAFGAGLLTRGYSMALTGIDLNAQFIPHGFMIGAGLVALGQVVVFVLRQNRHPVKSAGAGAVAAERTAIGPALRAGAFGYLAIMMLLALGTGLYKEMSVTTLLLFIVYSAIAAYVHEFIVGVAAMHAGWFPAFAVALITLLIGILIGFPPDALVVLAGFSAATGPAFADMGYDLKAGYLLRGEGADPAFERDGRIQQTIAGMLGFAVAVGVVAFSYPTLFANNQFAPINVAYVAAIKAGISSGTAINLALWAIPGALVQLVGGSSRQLGVLFATGLLIGSPLAGAMVALGLILRVLARRFLGNTTHEQMEVFAGGVIAGDAIVSFIHSFTTSVRK